MLCVVATLWANNKLRWANKCARLRCRRLGLHVVNGSRWCSEHSLSRPGGAPEADASTAAGGRGPSDRLPTVACRDLGGSCELRNDDRTDLMAGLEEFDILEVVEEERREHRMPRASGKSIRMM